MDKVNFQDGTKISSAKVTIDGVDYPVTPARYTGATPLSALVMNTMQNNIEDAIDQNISNIGGEDYDETATYEEGDIVKYEGQLYICIEAIDTPEEWDSTKWNATDVLSSAGGNEVAIGDSTAVTSKTKIWVDTDDETDVFSEVVDSLSGNELNKAPSVHAVNAQFTTTNWVDDTSGGWSYRLYNGICYIRFNDYQISVTANTWYELGLIPNALKPNSNLILVGANNGYDTQYLTGVTSTRKVRIYPLSSGTIYLNGMVSYII